MKNKIVIFDSHEDVTALLLEKEWIPKFIRVAISKLYSSYEKKILKKIDAIVTVTPTLTNRIKKINSNTIQITNYPIANTNKEYIDNREWNPSVCFAGNISNQWLHQNIIKAIENIDEVTYQVAGIVETKYFKQLSILPGFQKVNYIGLIPQKNVCNFIQKSMIGIALNNYNANVGYKEGSLGNTKLFEYMLSGIPVICTDFRLWKEIVEENHCGISVNPNDIEAISGAIKYLINNPDIAKQMGDNGRKAVLEKYNWASQEEDLLKMYRNFNNYDCSKSIKVCHFTSVHPALDGRIFYKECTSLAKAGFEVFLIAPNAKDENINGINILGVKAKMSNRLYRMIFLTKKVYKKALEIDADIYHFHDPELLPYGIKIKNAGK